MNLNWLWVAVPSFILTVFYLPVILVFYWLTHVRRQISANRQVIRTKELSFFFLRTLDEQWKLGSHLAMAILPTLVLMVGYALSAASLSSLFAASDQVSPLLSRLDLAAVDKYIRPVFFGFLGAYMFMLQTTLRRYLDDDLNIDTHITLTVRVLMALIVSFVAGFVLPAEYKDAGVGAVLVYGAAFVFGVMPERGFETLYRIVTGWLGERFKGGQEHGDDLQACLGFDRIRLARLNVENVKTVEDMAHVEIERLAQKTRYDLQAIFYWVDRAVFYSRLEGSAARAVLESQGIRTFTSFEVIYRDTDKRERLQAQIDRRARRDAGQAPDAGSLDLDIVYTAMMRLPNTQLVRLFVDYKAMQATGSFDAANRADAFEKMGQYAEAVVDYEKALQRNRFDPTLLTRLGRARALYAQQQMKQGHFAGGHKAFDDAFRDLQNALNILPSLWEARLQRAIALLAQQPYLFDDQVIERNLARAVEDLREARNHNAGELEIVNWLARACLEQQQPQEVVALADDMDRLCTPQTPAFVKSTAKLLLAQALIAQAATRDKEAQKSDLLDRASAHIAIAQSLTPRSSMLFLTQALYYHLDSPGSKQEERFLEMALQPGEVRIAAQDVDYTSAPLHRGQAYEDEIYERWGQLIRDRGEIRKAVACFTQAIAQNPARASSYRQRGALYERLGDLEAAIADYDFLIDPLGCETAGVYLARARARALSSIRRPASRSPAQHDIEQAIALAPAQPEPLIAWGDWQRLSGDYQDALETYAQVEKLTSGWPKARREGVLFDVNVGVGLAYCGALEHGEARHVLGQLNKAVKGRDIPLRLELAWGVFYSLSADDAEARMRVQDALSQLAQVEGWDALRAADLRQLNDVLETLSPAGPAVDGALQIRIKMVEARLASLFGEADAMTRVEAVCADIAALPDDPKKADLDALLRRIDELERFL